VAGLFDVAVQQVMLAKARYTLATRVSRELADTLTMHTRMADMMANDLALEVSVRVLTEQLPQQSVTHRVHEDHPEAVGVVGFVKDARFARPIDHFTAKYRGRWWGWWLGLRLRKIRYDQVPVQFRNTSSVWCDHTVTVDIADQWTYPQASPALSGAQGGPPVLISRLNDVTSDPTILNADVLPW
jgi:hypothetical protein